MRLAYRRRFGVCDFLHGMVAIWTCGSTAATTPPPRGTISPAIPDAVAQQKAQHELDAVPQSPNGKSSRPCSSKASSVRERAGAAVAGLRAGLKSARDSLVPDSLEKQVAEAVVKYPLPSHWAAAVAPSGDVYYWNKVTDETTWQHPLTGAARELLEAVRDCKAVDPIAGSISASEKARKRRFERWARKWQDSTDRELESWRCVDGDTASGTQAYFYRVPSTVSTSVPSDDSSTTTTTWEDPRTALELRLRFKSETLASLLSLPAPELTLPGVSGSAVSPNIAVQEPCATPCKQIPAFDHHAADLASGEVAVPTTQQSAGCGASPKGSHNGAGCGIALSDPPTEGWETPGNCEGLRRTERGQWFIVEPMPADHSCGFHGLGLCREEAAELLLRHGKDPDVQDFIAVDLVAALHTGDRDAFPADIRSDERLWGALDAYYSAQQSLDERRREARDLLGDAGNRCGAADPRAAGSDVAAAVQSRAQELHSEASGLPAGAARSRLLQSARKFKSQAYSVALAEDASKEAESALRNLCRMRADAYVTWVGSDTSFWLSFVRGCGDDRGGGLLDALAKVCGLTVCVWAEGTTPTDSSKSEPDLELVHEAAFGDRVVHLWFQGDRGHFDRLVPYAPPSSRDGKLCSSRGAAGVWSKLWWKAAGLS